MVTKTHVPLALICSVLLVALLAMPSLASLRGAVWTSTVNGEMVNANLYDQKCPPPEPYDAPPPTVPYLNGGPNFASPARWVPDGSYYFQVTDPSGKVLLSNDDIAERRFVVDTDADGKKYIIYTGNHRTGTDLLSGVTTIALCPFTDTPNNGGVYKLWITPCGAYDPSDPRSHFGFIPANSKTDNFKIRRQASIWGNKVDAETDDPLEGLHIILYSVIKVRGVERLERIADTVTDGNGEFSFSNLSVGKYAVDEDLPGTDHPSEGLEPIDYSGWARVSPPGPIYFTITKAQIGKRGEPGEPTFVGTFRNRRLVPPSVVVFQGLKFLDANGDGKRDGDTEPTLSGWTMILERKVDNGEWAYVASTATDANGEFIFPGLSVNLTYRVSETPQTGWLQTAPNTGPDEIVLWRAADTYATVSPDSQPVVVMAANGRYVVNLAGVASSTTVGGLRFGNKLADICVLKQQSITGDPVAGFTFMLYQADGVTPALCFDPAQQNDETTHGWVAVTAQTTEAEGSVCWHNLLPGNYVIRELAKPGWRPEVGGGDSQTVTLTTGGKVTVTFTNYALSCGLTPGYWANWRNHYTDEQFTTLLAGTIAGDIAAADAIFGWWAANPDDHLTILRAFLLADQLTINLTQHPDLPNPSGGSLVPESTLVIDGVTVTLGDVIADALDILADPASYSREEVLAVKDLLAAFAESQMP